MKKRNLTKIGLLYTGRWVVRSTVTSKRTGSCWEVRITVCYSDIACSCMTQWETPEVPCGCYGCTECMFAMKLHCKYAGCRQPQSQTLTPAGMWAATRGFFASCWSEYPISACLASCWSACTGFMGVWAATRGSFASCWYECIGLRGVDSHPRLYCKL